MTDLVPLSLAQTLAAIQSDIAELHRAIERATITPAPEWVRVDDAARIEGVSVSACQRSTGKCGMASGRATGRVEAQGG